MRNLCIIEFPHTNIVANTVLYDVLTKQAMRWPQLKRSNNDIVPELSHCGGYMQ